MKKLLGALVFVVACSGGDDGGGEPEPMMEPDPPVMTHRPGGYCVVEADCYSTIYALDCVNSVCVEEGPAPTCTMERHPDWNTCNTSCDQMFGAQTQATERLQCRSRCDSMYPEMEVCE